METWFLAGAVVCAVVAAVWDVQQGRVPNRLTYGAMVTGLALRTFLEGWRGTLDGLAAGVLGGGVFFLFFLVRGMGAGDVKLMAAVGVWTGLGHLPVAMLASALAGGILALAYMVIRGRGFHTLRNLGKLFRHHLASGLAPHPEINLQNPQAIRIPYALAIAAGTFYAFGLTYLRG